MKNLLIPLLLMPMVSFSYDDYDYDYKYGGGGILPDWFGVIIAIGLVGCLIFGFISLPFWIYSDKKEEKEAKIEHEKMRARLKRIGMPEEQITEEEITKYRHWLQFIEGNNFFKEPSEYRIKAKRDNVDLKYVKKLLKLCDASKHGEINWNE